MNKLTKQLLSLVLCVLMVVDSGLSAGVTGYAMESPSAVRSISHYAVKALADLPEDVAYQVVEFGTPESSLDLPKTIFALACDADADAETDEDDDADISIEYASASEVNEAADSDTEKASISEIDDESVSTLDEATKSVISKNIDFITDEQREEVKKLLSSKDKPSIKNIEKETGLDLDGYSVIKLPLSWENDASFGGEYDPDEPGIYRFTSEVEDEDKYVLFDSSLPTISVEVLEEAAVEFSAAWSDDDVEIVVAAPAGVFPNGSSLKVEKISKDRDNLKIDEAVEKALDDDKVIDSTLSYDIKVVDAEGKELDPVTEGDRKVNITFKSKKILDAAESEDKYISVYHFKDIDKEDVEKAAKADDDKESFIENIFEAWDDLVSGADQEEKLEAPELVKAEEPENVSVDEERQDAPESDDSINVSVDGELSVNTEDFSVYTIAFYSDKAKVKGYYTDLSSESFSSRDGDTLTVELTGAEDSNVAANYDAAETEDEFKTFIEQISSDPSALEEFYNEHKTGSVIDGIPAETALGLISDSDSMSFAVTKVTRDGVTYRATSSEVSAVSGETDGTLTHKSVSWALDDTFYVKQTTKDLTGEVTYELTGFGSNGGKATIVITDEDGETREIVVTSENDDKKEFNVNASDVSFTIAATDILSINPKEYQNKDYTMVSETGEISGQVLSNKQDAPTSFEITNVKTYAYSVGQEIKKGGETFEAADDDAITYSLKDLKAGDEVIVRTEGGEDTPYTAGSEGTLDITVSANVASFSVITKSKDAKISAVTPNKAVNNIVLAAKITDENNLKADNQFKIDYIVPNLTVEIYDEKDTEKKNPITAYTANSRDPKTLTDISKLFTVSGYRYRSASLRVGDTDYTNIKQLSDFQYKTSKGTFDLTEDAVLTLTYAEYIEYPVYLKLENVPVSSDKNNPTYLTFKILDRDAAAGRAVSVSGLPSGSSYKDDTLTIKLDANKKEYSFTVKSDDETLRMYLDVTGDTKYQVISGIGETNAIDLLRKQENSNKKENIFFIEGRSTNQSVKKYWEDGGKTPEEKNKFVGNKDVDVSSYMYLEYSLGPDYTEWKKLDADAMKELGYSEANVPLPVYANIVKTQTSYVYNFKDVLFDKKVDVIREKNDTGAIVRNETVETNIRYRLAEEDELKKHYFSKYENENGDEDPNGSVLRNYEIQTFTATIQWNDIDKLGSDRPSIENWKQYVSLYKIVKGDADHPATMSVIWKDKEEKDYLVSDYEECAATVTDNGDNTWTVTVKGYAYDKGDYNVHYYLTQEKITGLEPTTGEEGNAITNRRYEPTYNNVGNASNKTNGVYNGGTLVNILAGDTDYVMYKLWKDEATKDIVEARPKASILVYRYARTSEDRWTYRSPIQDQVYVPIVKNIDNGENKLYELTIPGSGALSAYNGDGVQLIYIGKEHTEGGSNSYVRSLIRRPDSEDPNDTTLHGGQFILNGEKLVNLITDKVTVKATKTWTATARQDIDAEVELNVYSRDRDGKVEPASTSVLTGFSSEQKSKSHSWTLDKYDKEGRRLYYYVDEGYVSTKVADENDQEGFKAAEKIKIEDGPLYYLTADGYRYVQEMETEVNTDGNVNVDITNRLVGNAQVKITKRFPEGISLGDIERKEATVSFDVFRDNEKIGVISKTYKVGSIIRSYDGEGNLVSKEITDLSQLQQDFTDVIIVDRFESPMEIPEEAVEGDNKTLINYYRDKKLLPRYDLQGAEYTYSVFEHEDAMDRGYNPTYENIISEEVYSGTSDTDIIPYIADRDKYLVDEIRISNNLGKGEYITVYKEWLDGEESQKRQKVTFELQYKAAGESTWNSVGTPSYIAPNDEVYSKYSFMKIPSEVHDQFVAWRDNDYSPTATSGDFRVIETYMGDNPVHYYTGAGRTIVDDFSNKDYYLGHFWNKYEGKEETFSELQKKQYEDDDYGFVQGDFYDYDVLICNSESAKDESGTNRYINYQYNEDGNVIGNRNFDFAISNVRVGVIYIDIKKEWVDGRMKDISRPDSLKLKVQVGNELVDLTLDESNDWSAKLGPYRKYDDEGKLIDYKPHLVKNSEDKYEEFIYRTGREDAAKKYKDAYVMSGNTAEFELGKDHHTGDRYSFAIKNTLSATITPVVNKFWDDYDDRDNDRPDIYSHLYRKYTDENKVDHVELLDTKSYIDYDWDTTSFDKKAHNWWQVKYNPQSRFTEEFYEYEYYISESYASENTNEYAEIGAFEGAPKYTDVTKQIATFSTIDKDLQKLEYKENGKDVVIVAAKVALNEDDAGTLVNRPRNKRTVSGVKIYENLPDGYSNKNLPDVELELWRRPYGEPEGSPKEEKVPEYDIIRDLMGQEDLEATDNNLVAILEGANELYKRNFTFYKGNKTENDENKVQAYVPKYDNTGRPYTYFVKEADTYSILDAKKGEKETAERIKVLHAAYDFEVTENDTLTNGIKAVNKYKETKNYSVKFCKKWDGFKPENEYDEKYLDPVHGNDMPKITIRLYRYLQNADGNIINGTGKILDEQELTYKIDKNDPDKSGYAYAEWNDLVYYAPNLNPYKYVISEKVEETSDGGKVPYTRAYDVYNASVAVDEDGNYILENGHAKLEAKENLKTGASSKITFDETRSAKATTSTIEERKVVRHDSSWDGYDVAVDGSYDIDSGKGSGAAGIINTYRKDREPLKVLKIWNIKDSGYDGISILPKEINFNLYRLYHNNSTAESNRTLIKKDKDKYSFTLNEANNWTATISELLKYEPTRGYYYRYYVEEVIPKDWVKDFMPENLFNKIKSKIINPQDKTYKSYIPFVVETRDGKFWYGGAGVKGTPDGVVYLDGGVDGTNPPEGEVVDKETGKVVTVTGRKNVFKTIDLHAVKKFKSGKGNEEISGEKLLELYNKKALPESITYRIYYQIQYNEKEDKNRMPDDWKEWKLLEQKDPETNVKTPVTMYSEFQKTLDENGKEIGKYSTAEKKELYPTAFIIDKTDKLDDGTYREIKYRAVEYSVTYPDGTIVDREDDIDSFISNESIRKEVDPETNKEVIKTEGTGFGEFSKVESVCDVIVDIKDKEGNIVENNPYYSETTVINTLDLTRLDVTKAWKDEVRGFDSKVDHIVFELQRRIGNGDWSDVKSEGKVLSAELSHADAAAGKTVSFEYLPTKDPNGNEYSYRAVEKKIVLKDGTETKPSTVIKVEVTENANDSGNQEGGTTAYEYKSENTDPEKSEGIYTKVLKTDFTNRLRLGSISVSKIWDDMDDKYELRTDINVRLTASVDMKDKSGEKSISEEIKTLNAANGYKESWSELPIYDADGTAINYTVKEYAVVEGKEVEFRSYDATNLVKVDGGIAKDGDTTERFAIATDSTIVEFTNKLATTSFIVKKAWDTEDTDPTNANEEYERRVYVELEYSYDGETWYPRNARNGQNIATMSEVLSKDNDYTHEWNDLPLRNNKGDRYIYRAKETNIVIYKNGQEVKKLTVNENKNTVGGYNYNLGKTEQAEDRLQKATLSNILKKGDYAITKIWDDDENRDGLRPDEVTFHLERKAKDGEWTQLPSKFDRKITNQTEAGEGKWSIATWSQLPVEDAKGDAYSYRAVEDEVSHYEMRAIKSETFIERIVDGFVDLVRNIATWVLDLLGFADEVLEAEPADVGINLTEGEMSISTYSNIHRISTVDIDAVKKWDDMDDKYGDRPKEIKVTLYATYTNEDGIEVTEEVTNLELAYDEDKKITNPETLKASNGWKASWTGLPAYKRGLVGSRITYSVEETEVKGYEGDITLATESSIEKNEAEKWEFSIKNTLDPVDIVVRKNWDNEFAGIGDGVTGAEVVLQRKTGAADWANVYVTVDGKESLMTHVINKTDSSWTVKDLPKYDKDGNEYSYRAVETRIILSDGSKVNVKDDGLVKGTVGAYVYTSTTEKTETGFRTDITNRMDTGSLRVSKVWDDENNSKNRRPAEIKVNLKTLTVTGGKENEINIDGISKTVTLSAANNWSDAAVWADVPVYTADGKRIYYVLSEEGVSGYDASYSSVTYGQVAVTGNGIEASRVYLENGQTSEVEFTNRLRTGGGKGGNVSSSRDPGSPSDGSVKGADRETPDEGSVLGADRDMPEEPRVLGAARRPGTGDMSHMTIYGITAVFSLAILGAWLSVYKKKKKQNAE
ncbi:Cna B-type domain-containing protein [Oribacterium sp. FC2011]|uniref:Cna B-type domain-containing protein n=1 Tax=Oribacterium sp. FC2011 TaxID=1408311 RepID=UPI0018CC2134|nr:Cna B-type domain-containing protein [Oribacterium sp. FC2011]